MEKPLFGVALGANRGVEGFSNYSSTRAQRGSNYVNGYYTGYKYQCVEYARRWMIIVKNSTFAKINCACDIWDLNTIENLTTGEHTPLMRIPNGSQAPPQPGALLIYKRRLFLPFGHVAIITDVNLNQGQIRIAEQNEDDNWWPGDYSRELRLDKENNGYFIRDQYALYGWMVYEDFPQLPQESKSRCSIF